MRIVLYSATAPSGRCLLLGQAIAQVEALPPVESLEMAKMLFSCQFDESSPAVLYVQSGVDLTRLKATCKECGVIMEEVE